jgi:hypothetical protein
MATRMARRVRVVGDRLVAPLVGGMLALGAAVALPSTAVAQRGGGDGFLFDRPSASLTLRGGFTRPTVDSEIFTFITDTLTLGRRDFDGATFGASLGIWISPRFDIVLSADHATQSKQSRFENWWEEGPTTSDEDDLPIRQTTRFARTPLALGVRAYLLPRGRSIGQFAWVPARVAPYIGIGAGAMYYEFEQDGDFVDFVDETIFTDILESSGWSATANGTVGFDLSLSPRVALTTEGKYTWAEAAMSEDFVDFDRIDLSGLSASIGLTFRF